MGSFATSYIPTSTVASTRNADVLTYPSAGNLGDTAGTVYCEATWQGTNNRPFISPRSATGGQALIRDVTSGQLGLYDGTATRAFGASTALSATQPTVVKLATSWGGVLCQGAVAGAIGTAQTFDGSLNSEASLGIGANNDGSFPINGTIKNVRIWTRALADSQMVSLTQ